MIVFIDENVRPKPNETPTGTQQTQPGATGPPQTYSGNNM